MVRLAPKHIETLVEATYRCFGETAKIWVFGSRADDSKRGGDIDLYIETDLSEGTVAAKIKFRSLIWSTFGEQKIDILIRRRSKPLTPIQCIAKESGTPLN